MVRAHSSPDNPALGLVCNLLLGPSLEDTFLVRSPHLYRATVCWYGDYLSTMPFNEVYWGSQVAPGVVSNHLRL
jgi:hypothetical protein